MKRLLRFPVRGFPIQFPEDFHSRPLWHRLRPAHKRTSRKLRPVPPASVSFKPKGWSFTKPVNAEDYTGNGDGISHLNFLLRLWLNPLNLEISKPRKAVSGGTGINVKEDSAVEAPLSVTIFDNSLVSLEGGTGGYLNPVPNFEHLAWIVCSHSRSLPNLRNQAIGQTAPPHLTATRSLRLCYNSFVRKPLRDRLFEKIDKNGESGCWEWKAYRNPDGYGRFSVQCQGQMAHRVVYELVVGPIPQGLELDHLCRNRGCVNPDHLEAVTTGENIRRGDTGKLAKARAAAKTHCPQGHPYNKENTRTYIKDGYPSRNCIECNRERSSLYYYSKI